MRPLISADNHQLSPFNKSSIFKEYYDCARRATTLSEFHVERATKDSQEKRGQLLLTTPPPSHSSNHHLTAPSPITEMQQKITKGGGHRVELEDDPTPERFLRAVDRDEVEAKRRWHLTKEWRQTFQIDSILEKPQHHFDAIKKYYPHYIHRKSNEGQYIYIEQPGKAKLKQLWDMNITLDDILWHYIYVTEFLWKILDPDDLSQLVFILDLEGAAFSDFTGNTFKLFKQCSEVMQNHYPERNAAMYIINAAWWFHGAWAVASPFLDFNTKKKIRVLGSNYKTVLREELGESNLPKCYGGIDDKGLGESPEEDQLLRFVQSSLVSHKY